MRLQRFWIEFDRNSELPIGFNRGCGVTAANEADALSLLKSEVFSERKLPKILNVRRGVCLDDLDQNDVRNNMGNPARRGIWFPLGYGSR